MTVQTRNNGFSRLSGRGTYNTRNRVNVRSAESDDIGVEVRQGGRKMATELSLFVPITRSGTDSRRVAAVRLTGRQAREIYETLARHFDYDLNF